MDNAALARLFAEVGDLLEIKGENPFKIRAYRNASETVAHAGVRVSELDETQLLAISGIGKDLAKKIREAAETGRIQFHQDLLAEFPPTILDLLALQGVGPKTVRQLYAELGVRTIEDLESAARDGRLTELKGMGPKKQALILRAVDERRRHAGRHLLANAADAAAALVGYLRADAPGVDFVPVGSMRRGCETCGDLDVLAIGGGPALMDVFTRYRLVERVLGHGDTKSSVLLQGGVQADLRLVPAASRGAAMQYFTGSKAHNIALRDRALQRGWKLNEYGLFDETGTAIAGETEEGVYAALGLAWVPPELREHRGEIEAADTGRLPRLVERVDLRGDLHMHTTTTDGRDDIESMARAARDLGYQVHRHHRSQPGTRHGQRPRRAPGARARAANSRGERPHRRPDAACRD